jgi:hypothetical protein
MAGELGLEKKDEVAEPEEDHRPLGRIEEAVNHLLIRYHEVLKENEELARTLRLERKRNDQLAEKLEMLSLDREKVKTRIDQLLLQLKVLDV